jgi:hypothetical protein
MTIMRRALKPQARHQFLNSRRGPDSEKKIGRDLPHRAALQQIADAPNAQRAFCGYLSQPFLLLPSLRRHFKSGAIGV